MTEQEITALLADCGVYDDTLPVIVNGLQAEQELNFDNESIMGKGTTES